MKYAIFRVSGTVRYGIHAPDVWGADYELIERFRTIRAASASLKMRNDAVKSMTKAIGRAGRVGADEGFLDTLRAIRDADCAPYGPSALSRMHAVEAAVSQYDGAALSGFDKMTNDVKHASNLKAYEAAVEMGVLVGGGVKPDLRCKDVAEVGTDLKWPSVAQLAAEIGRDRGTIYNHLNRPDKHPTVAGRVFRYVDRHPEPGSIDAMTDAEREAARARAIALGYTPKF